MKENQGWPLDYPEGLFRRKLQEKTKRQPFCYWERFPVPRGGALE